MIAAAIITEYFGWAAGALTFFTFGASADMLMLICLSNSFEWSTVPMPVIISVCRGPNWEHSHTVRSVFRCRFGKFVFSQNFESKF